MSAFISPSLRGKAAEPQILRGRHVRVDRAMMELGLYIPKAPTTDEERIHWDKNMQLVLDVVTGEDFPAGRTMQIGFTSGAQTHVVYGRNEPGMIHYHQSMRSARGLDRRAEAREAPE